MTSVSDKTIKVNDTNIHFHEYSNEGKAIIFLHFGFSSSAMWNGILPFFKGKYHLIVPDCRGHGLSDKPRNGYHIDEMGDDIVSLMNELNVEKAHFVGSSPGSEISISIAARFPDRVLSVIVEGSAMNNKYGVYGLRNLSEQEIELEKKEIMKRVLTPQPTYDTPEDLINHEKKFWEERGLWNEVIKEWKKYEIYPTEDGKYTASIPNWVKKEYMKNYFSFQFEKYYEKINAPILFLPAEEDWKNRQFQTVLNYFSSLVKNSHIELIKGATHAFVWLFKTEEISKIILNFLHNVDEKEYQ